MSAVRAAAVRGAEAVAGLDPRAAVTSPDRVTAPGRPDAPAAPARAPRPRLRVVGTPAQRRTRVPFVALCMSVLASSLLGALLLHTSMAQGEYERLGLQSRLAEASASQEEIRALLERAQSPTQLAAAATALGMVPTTTGGYLRLADGAVLGSPAPAGAPQ